VSRYPLSRLLSLRLPCHFQQGRFLVGGSSFSLRLIPSCVSQVVSCCSRAGKSQLMAVVADMNSVAKSADAPGVELSAGQDTSQAEAAHL
jgi:hypothetical protein